MKNRKQKHPSLWELFIEWLKSYTNIYRVIVYLFNFWYIWGGLIALLFISWIVASCDWGLATKLIGVILALITALFLLRPMNAVYGMMGTRGSIPVFFMTFILISILFAGIYQLAFFKDAGISYDVNQPHIDYNHYVNEYPKEVKQSDTIIYKRLTDSIWVEEIVVHETQLNYQPIGFFFTWRNTILTTLMQEPTELFSAASTYNESIVAPSLTKEQQKVEILLDKQKAKMFQWILIFQVLISWIFFGVFISLLYNKFRYES